MFEKEFNIIKYNLENNINFSFIKMNYGEISCIINKKGNISRGLQVCDENLANELYNALIYGNNDKNYFVGIPCKECYPELYNYAIKYVKNPFNANLLINSNFNKTYDILEKNLQDKFVVLICNEESKIDNLNFKPKIILKVPSKNSWDFYKYYKNGFNIIPENSIVIFCCGPLGRVLAYEWYKNNKNITCIELGSFYDPWLLGKSYMYHLGLLKECNECNPTNSLPISDNLIISCNHLERYYFENYSNNLLRNFYKNNLNKLRQYYLICKKNIENDKLKFYCDYMFYYYDFQLNPPSQEHVENVLNNFLKNYPNRVEAIFELRKYLNSSKKLEYLLKIKNIPHSYDYKDEILDIDMYLWKILDCIVVESYYENNYELSYSTWKELMLRKHLIPKEHLDRCIDNGRYAKLILDQKDSYNIFHNELDEISNKYNIIDNIIPRFFHFIFISGGHKFVMSHYLAIKTCFEINKPEKIFIWYNDSNNLLENNKWWKMISAYVIMIKITIPTFINNHEVIYKQHQADIMRINILNKMGGIYMDLDVLSLNPLDGSIKTPLFVYTKNTDKNLYNHEIVLCRESPDKFCNCVIMARNEHPFLKKWIEAYENMYGEVEDTWVGLSVRMPYKIFSKNTDLNITIVNERVFLPFLYNDDSIFRKNDPEKIEESLTVHLWDTESFKYGWIPEDINYFENFPNTLFTHIFKKYII